LSWTELACEQNVRTEVGLHSGVDVNMLGYVCYLKLESRCSWIWCFIFSFWGSVENQVVIKYRRDKNETGHSHSTILLW